MPLSSSPSMKLERKSLIGVAWAMARFLLPEVPGRLDHESDDDEPDQRDRDEDLPAEPHDLVVAKAGKRRSRPAEQRCDDERLGEQPEPVPEPHRLHDRSGRLHAEPG